MVALLMILLTVVLVVEVVGMVAVILQIMLDGGSGYVYTSSTVSSYPSGCKLNSSYYLTDAQTIAGNQSFPNVAGTGNETGHSGNGAAKITPVN